MNAITRIDKNLVKQTPQGFNERLKLEEIQATLLTNKFPNDFKMFPGKTGNGYDALFKGFNTELKARNNERDCFLETHTDAAMMNPAEWRREDGAKVIIIYNIHVKKMFFLKAEALRNLFNKMIIARDYRLDKAGFTHSGDEKYEAPGLFISWTKINNISTAIWDIKTDIIQKNK